MACPHAFSRILTECFRQISSDAPGAEEGFRSDRQPGLPQALDRGLAA
jgi:hypothetical protein